MTQFGGGDSVIVQYAGDAQPELWHERLLLAPVGVAGMRWIAVTPDGEMQVLDLDEVSAFRALLANRRLPRGIREADCYLIYFDGRATNFYSALEMRDLIEEGKRMADLYTARPRPAAPVLPVQLARVAAAAPVPGAVPRRLSAKTA